MNRAISRSTSRWQWMAGNRRLFLLCLLLFIGSSFVSLWTFFPAEILQRRLVHEVSLQTGLQMQGSNASMLFPFGLKLDLRVLPEVEFLVPVDLKELQISPVWLSLIRGTPAVDLYAGLAGGTFEVQADQAGQLAIEIDNVSLIGLQQEQADYRLQGKLSGDFAGQQLSAAMTGSGEFSLLLQNAELLGLEKWGLPEAFALGIVTLEGKLNQRRLSLEKVLLTGGLLEMSGGGTMLLAETPAKSRLNLNIRLSPTPSTPGSLRDLLSLTGVKPTTDGSYLLRIGGNLERPVLR